MKVASYPCLEHTLTKIVYSYCYTYRSNLYMLDDLSPTSSQNLCTSGVASSSSFHPMFIDIAAVRWWSKPRWNNGLSGRLSDSQIDSDSLFMWPWSHDLCRYWNTMWSHQRGQLGKHLGTLPVGSCIHGFLTTHPLLNFCLIGFSLELCHHTFSGMLLWKQLLWKVQYK